MADGGAVLHAVDGGGGDRSVRRTRRLAQRVAKRRNPEHAAAIHFHLLAFDGRPRVEDRHVGMRV